MKIEEYKERLRAAIEQGRDIDYAFDGEDERAVATFETSWALDAVMEVLKDIKIEEPVIRAIPEPELRRIFEVYRPPFKYDQNGQYVFDIHNHMVVDIRGWGYLQRFTDGEQIQDNVGRLVTELLNKEYERLKKA